MSKGQQTKESILDAALQVASRIGFDGLTIGQLADTMVFCTIAAPALGMALWSGDYWNYVVIGFVWKTLVEAVLLPVTYLVIAWIKKREPSYQAALSGPAVSQSAA